MPTGEERAKLGCSSPFGTQVGFASDAERLIRSIVRKYPNYAEAHAALAGVLWGEGRLGAAEEQLSEAIEFEPNFRNFRLVLESTEFKSNFQNFRLVWSPLTLCPTSGTLGQCKRTLLLGSLDAPCTSLLGALLLHPVLPGSVFPWCTLPPIRWCSSAVPHSTELAYWVMRPCWPSASCL